MNWLPLDSLSQLNEIVNKESFKETIFLFKHSTRCSISSLAKSRLESSWENYFPNSKIYLLDLLKHRSVSDQIATDLGVFHQSPQLIAVSEARSILDASHLAIDAKRIFQQIEQ